MQRYFIKNEQMNKNTITINDQDFHHIKNVMRMKTSDNVEVVNENGLVYLAEIVSFSKTEVILNIIKNINENNELKSEITIGLALARQSKHEEVLKRITELGATKFIPVEMTRSVIKFNKSFNQTRLEMIVKEASEQSKRNKLLEVSEATTLKNLLKNINEYDYLIYAYEDVKDKNIVNIKQLIKDFKNKKALILVGPEGGFTNDEVSLLNKHKFIPIGLGPRILRLETAAIYIMSIISYELEL